MEHRKETNWFSKVPGKPAFTIFTQLIVKILSILDKDGLTFLKFNVFTDKNTHFDPFFAK